MSVRKELESGIHDYVTSLRRYALVLTRNGDAAEDLVQETLVKAIGASDSWQLGTDLRVWMFRIMHNTHVSERRRHQVREQAKPMLPKPVDTTDPTMRIELQQVLDALDQLPEAQRQPIVLIALQQMSYAEAARVLDVPLGTFYSRIGRGRTTLRRIVEELKPTPPNLVVCTEKNG
ncbi:putative RNA polymerase sigma factor 7 [Octadecabacter antarcticus 307]|uniref:Putative RNA polymerase sigma factor 7 n=1 Tax=Octadecabacter antarcticus 307 TaxID=391626 RepID=M9R9J4_9RHOB|nr:sigma-70 family RNA polymerase sigma factor [Octadecabacter antarcticus]AGI68877.1 putative RNA polymerase sigma factor 7 [Octadecabacter antarcticus 307]